MMKSGAVVASFRRLASGWPVYVHVYRWWLSVFLVGMFGCASRKDVPCNEDEHCDLEQGGACLAGSSASWCAYPDTTCPSGFRFSDFDVGDGVSGQCVGAPVCMSHENCDASAPICDADTRSCRGCREDSECDSTVCDALVGNCIDETAIAYATVGGSETAECQRVQPCSIARAIAVARQSGKTVRLLPGVYATPIEVSTSNVTPLMIVASGVTLTSFTGVLVTNGANVNIRGLSATGANQALRCGDTASTRAKITFTDGDLVAASSSSGALAAIANCEARMSNVRFMANESTGGSLALGTDSSFDGDRLHFLAQQQSLIGTIGTRISLRITNSLLENVVTIFSTNDQSPGSVINFAFNTFVMKYALDCLPNSGSDFRSILFENNIIAAPTQVAAIEGTSCAFSNNILSPQPNAPTANIVADPQFVDAPMKNYRVKPTSPAVGAALSAPMISTDHDFEGRPRPAGGAADIGAFEQ
jgi:hypothetical protein